MVIELFLEFSSAAVMVVSDVAVGEIDIVLSGEAYAFTEKNIVDKKMDNNLSFILKPLL